LFATFIYSSLNIKSIYKESMGCPAYIYTTQYYMTLLLVIPSHCGFSPDILQVLINFSLSKNN